MSLVDFCKPLMLKVDEQAFLHPKGSDKYKKTEKIRKRVNKELRKAIKEFKESPDYWNYNKIEPFIRAQVVDELDKMLPPWSKFSSDSDTEEATVKCLNNLWNAQILDSETKDAIYDCVERFEKELKRRSRVPEGTVVNLWD